MKRVPQAVLLISLIFWVFLSSQSQTIREDESLPLTKNQILSIQQLEQFVNRFNYTKTFNGKPVDSAFKSKITRERYIKLLFNLEDSRIVDGNYEYLQKQSKFIQSVCNEGRPKYLSFPSNNLFAFAESVFITPDKKKKEITLILKSKISYTGSSSWVLWGVADYPVQFNLNNNDSYYIPPNSHETAFIELGRILNDNNKLLSLSSSNFRFNPSQFLLYDLYHNKLQFEHVKKIKFYYKDIPGWIIEISNFNRNTDNSGWLISDIFMQGEEVYSRINNTLNYSSHGATVDQVSSTTFISLKQYTPKARMKLSIEPGFQWAAAYQAGTILYTIAEDIKTESLVNKKALSPYFLENVLKLPQNRPPEEPFTMNNYLYRMKYTGSVLLDKTPYYHEKQLTDSLLKTLNTFKIKDYFPVIKKTRSNEINKRVIKEALLKKQPVVITLNAPPSFIKNKNKLWEPAIEENTQSRYTPEAITIVGFNDNQNGGVFEIMNSRGEKWGIDGFCLVRFDDLIDYSLSGYNVIYQ